ncbi:hypothetical protein HPB47_001183, partial [Ixodes persulcatus]
RRPPRSPRGAPSPEPCLARSSSAAAAARRTRRLTPFSADATGRTSCVHRVAVIKLLRPSIVASKPQGPGQICYPFRECRTKPRAL